MAICIRARPAHDPPSRKLHCGVGRRRRSSVESGPTCCGIPAATTSPTKAPIYERCRITLGTAIQSIRRTTPASLGIGSRTCGADVPGTQGGHPVAKFGKYRAGLSQSRALDVRLRIWSRLASVMRALPPQSSQVFCRKGKRDSTLPVARHVGQSVSVGAFVAIARVVHPKCALATTIAAATPGASPS